jgi:hypothetical protein
MEIRIQWHQPLPLTDGSPEDLIYMVDEDELKAWDGYAGVYIPTTLTLGIFATKIESVISTSI